MYRNRRKLIRPKGLVVERDSLSERYGKFVLETIGAWLWGNLGNALRRVSAIFTPRACGLPRFVSKVLSMSSWLCQTSKKMAPILFEPERSGTRAC